MRFESARRLSFCADLQVKRGRQSERWDASQLHVLHPNCNLFGQRVSPRGVLGASTTLRARIPANRGQMMWPRCRGDEVLMRGSRGAKGTKRLELRLPRPADRRCTSEIELELV
jgi:hypothetical protein